MAGGGIPMGAQAVEGGYLTGRKLIYPLSLVISLFFLCKLPSLDCITNMY